MLRLSIPNCLKKKKGSFLAEVLLAVSILSVGLTVVIHALLSSLRATVYTRDYSLAIILMENKMHELLQKGFIASSVKEENAFEPPFERFHYELETQPVASIEPEGFLNKVFLRCFWTSGKKTKDISLTTYLYNPTE